MADWIAENRALLALMAVGILLAGAVVPYHLATARAECRRRYALARSSADTVIVDTTTVGGAWARFPGLLIRCIAIRPRG